MAGELSRENWAAGLYEPEFWAHYLPRSCRSARALSLPCEGLEFSLWLRLWYIFVFGFFCSEVFVLAQEKLEGRAKSDFPAMVIHHAVTLVLIFTSWRYRLLRIGSVVAILHLNDVFMEVAKLSRYTNHYNLALASFVMFALSWLVLRLVLFPPLVLITAAGARASILGVLGRVAGPEYVRALTSLTYTLTGCLITVLGLDLYWGALIVGVMKKALTESVSNAGDSRED
jgi:ceramide synthetase